MCACKSCRSAAFSKTTTKHESKRQYFTYTRGVVFSHAQKVCVLKTVIGEVHMILTFVHPKYILPFKTIITYLFGEVFYPLITVIRESKKYFTRIKRKKHWNTKYNRRRCLTLFLFFKVHCLMFMWNVVGIYIQLETKITYSLHFFPWVIMTSNVLTFEEIIILQNYKTYWFPPN